MKSPLNRGGLRFYLVIIALLCGNLLNTTSAFSILAGLPCIMVGAWLHTWAKGCLRQNRVVATIGPYRFVRHPFYLANALIDVGLAVMAGWWPLMIALPFWWMAIYIPVMRREEQYLGENFPHEYPDYRRRVPCLIPWRRPLPYGGDGFRWSNPNIAGGEELPRVVRILAYPLLLFVVHGLRGGGLPWLNDGWNLTGLAGLIMFYALAWELHGHQRQGRWILPPAMRGPLFRVAVSTAILAAVCCVPGPRTSFRVPARTFDSSNFTTPSESAVKSGIVENFVPVGGAVLLLLSVPVFARRPARAVAAEMLALLGVIAAGELLWLTPPLVVMYAAWSLDWRLRRVSAIDHPSGAAIPASFWPYFYPVLVIAGAAVIGGKLIGHGLPYHGALF